MVGFHDNLKPKKVRPNFVSARRSGKTFNEFSEFLEELKSEVGPDKKALIEEIEEEWKKINGI